MTHGEVAQALKDDANRIILVYAFNSVGKTRLCTAYKDVTKDGDDHTGVYYNAYSEDLFVWDNDEENDGVNIRLRVHPSSLNRFHAQLTEDNIRDKLKAYNPTYQFEFNLYVDDPARGIETISFFVPNPNPDELRIDIKISRGEERVFVWCFFLALFEVEGWADQQTSHFFIDDPVSSLDENNIFITASTILDLIETHYESRKIIVTTHHIGLYSILYDCLKKGEKSDNYKKKTRACLLSGKTGSLTLETERKDVFLYHLRVLQLLEQAQSSGGGVRAYHFALLRQVLENVASFVGVGRVGYVLEQIGFDDQDDVARMINALSHKKVYYYESDVLVQDNLDMFNAIFTRLKDKYGFRLHAPGAAVHASEVAQPAADGDVP